jgi:aminoglycoside phosphotransferase family enzyme/cytidylate kinase
MWSRSVAIRRMADTARNCEGVAVTSQSREEERASRDLPAISQDDIIEFLSRAEAYGVGSVERIDTHISVVFLAGQRAYKLKRAIKTEYLDYSTLDLRRRFCEAEIEINRRTAPDLYLETAPVTRDAAGRLAIAGQGEIVEWLVVMKRFDRGALLDDLARAGRLTPALMLGAADAVAEMHAASPPAARREGTTPLREVIEQNESALFLRAPANFHASDVTEWSKAAEAALEAASATLDLRAQEGKIRQCHGDLHLRNICIHHGVPVPFDAVEFNDAINTIDVLYDLAFLLMDLDHRGERSLANLTLNRYLGITTDYAGLPALPLFLSVRAALRAHISAAVADAQPEKRGLDYERKSRAEPESYLALARRYLTPADAVLVAVAGLSGSGKSSVARAIAPHIGRLPGAIHIQSDVTRKRLFDVLPEVRLGAHAYDNVTSRRVYALLRERAVTTLKSGFSVVVDATFLDATERVAIEAAAVDAGTRFYGIWLDAPRRVLEKRIGARTADPSDATVEVLADQARATPGKIGWTTLYSGDSADATVARVLGQMSRDGVPGLHLSHGL